MKKLKNNAPKSSDLSPKDYERIGRMMEQVVMSGYGNQFRYYRMALVKGALVGFGSVIGATFFIALLLYILSFFETIPLIGPIIEVFQRTVENPPAPTP